MNNTGQILSNNEEVGLYRQTRIRFKAFIFVGYTGG
jgi:hypothetical protein